VNPEDNRRLSVYPHVEVERTAYVCPSGPSRDAGDQGRDGRVIWAGSRSEPARQGRGRRRSFDSGHGNGPPAHRRRVRLATPSSSTRVDRATHVPFRDARQRAQRTFSLDDQLHISAVLRRPTRSERSGAPASLTPERGAPSALPASFIAAGQQEGNKTRRDRPRRISCDGRRLRVTEGLVSFRLGRSGRSGRLIIRWSLVRIQAGP
jgi:hypothetical protein